MEHKIPRNIAVAGLALGFILLCIGVIAPYWEYYILDFRSILPTEDVNIGLWWGCTHTTSSDTCDYIDLSYGGSVNVKYWVTRFSSTVSVVFTVGSAINTMRTPGKKVSNVATAFMAAATGIITLAVYASAIDEITSNKIYVKNSRYDWAFYIYIAGTVIVGLSAILVCFTSSNDTLGQVVSHGAPGNMVVMASTTSQQQQHYPGGPQYPISDVVPGNMVFIPSQQQQQYSDGPQYQIANPDYAWEQKPQSSTQLNHAYSPKY